MENIEIKIGHRQVTLHNRTGNVVSPAQTTAVFKAISDEMGNLRVAAMQAEAASEAIETTRNDPDLSDQAKQRRINEAMSQNKNLLHDFRMAKLDGCAKNLLGYLKNQLRAAKPLAGDDVTGFLRDQELRGVVRSLDGQEKAQLITELYAGNNPQLADAILRTDPICSGLTKQQQDRLAFSRQSTENHALVTAVNDLVTAIRGDIRDIIAVRTWFGNLIYGSHDTPDEFTVRMTSLAELETYAASMQKVNIRQGIGADQPKEPVTAPGMVPETV